MMRILAILALFFATVFSHGIFYSAQEGRAVIISANFSQTIPAAYAQITIYQGDSAIPLLTSRLDSNGKFAFLPPEKDNYKVKLVATSDHGEHIQEFSIDASELSQIQNYEKPIYEKYAGILSAFGIIFGLFGIITMIKSRR